MKDRFEISAIGAFAGLMLWALFEYLPDHLGESFALFAALVGASVFFAVLMALVGPERPWRAVLPSAVLGFATSGLGLWAAMQFSSPEAFLDRPQGVLALGTLVFVSVPFAAVMLEVKEGWRDYARLFDSSWGIFIRYAAGWLFAGLVLLALYLSDELLKLVGVRIIDDILDTDPIRWTLIGGLFGLGAATAHELKAYVSPVLVHRLLRMLLPLLLVVCIVFIAALPLRGLSDLFGRLSTAGVLMSVAFAAVTLITTALDRDDESGVQMQLMRWSARTLAFVLPVFMGLATYAIYLRVSAYGWTPDRVTAAYICAFLVAYALVYAFAALRADWGARLRQGNLYLALALCVGAVLWLTPLINAERISSRSQIARYENGVTPDKLPLFAMAKRWGKAGKAALSDLEAHGDAELTRLVKRARDSDSRWVFDQDSSPQGKEARAKALAEKLVFIPPRPDASGFVGALDVGAFRRLHDACVEDMRECEVYLLPDDVDSSLQELGFVALRSSANSGWINGLRRVEGKIALTHAMVAYDNGDNSGGFGPTLFNGLKNGGFAFEPVTKYGLRVGDQIIIQNNLIR